MCGGAFANAVSTLINAHLYLNTSICVYPHPHSRVCCFSEPPIPARSRGAPAFPGSSGLGAAPGSEAGSQRCPGGPGEAIPIPGLRRPRGLRGDRRGHQDTMLGVGENILVLVLG